MQFIYIYTDYRREVERRVAEEQQAQLQRQVESLEQRQQLRESRALLQDLNYLRTSPNKTLRKLSKRLQVQLGDVAAPRDWW
jgi:phage-related tail protein